MLVAVYGTLKRGYGNHRLLESSTLVDTDVVNDYDLTFSGSIGTFPVAMPGEGRVHVEIYDIGDDESTLRRLDSLEGVPWMYKRETVVTQDSRTVAMYVGQTDCFGTNGIPVPVNSDGIHEWKRAYS